MLKYREIKFDKIILCGSILPRDFDWHYLFVRDQVGRVRNEYGVYDFPVKVCPFFVRGTGWSGRSGFLSPGTRCSNDRYDFQAHSDFFKPAHIRESWVRFLSVGPSRFEIVHGADITSAKAFEEYIEQIRSIDHERYASLAAHEAVELPPGYSRRWRNINPDIYTFLIDRVSNRACGYVNAMPLEDDAFAKITSGAMLDNQIPADAIVPYEATDKTVKLYVMSLAIAHDIGGTGGLLSEPVEMLLDGFFGRLRDHARNRRIRVSEVSAIGWTAEGRRICERLFGMTHTGTLRPARNPDGSINQAVEYPIYELDLGGVRAKEPAKMHRGLRKLIELYNEI
jgi:hypothetical protein